MQRQTADTESDCSTDDTTASEGESDSDDEVVFAAVTSRSGGNADSDTRSFIADSSSVADDANS